MKRIKKRINIDKFIIKGLQNFAGKDKIISFRIEDKQGNWLDGFDDDKDKIGIFLAFNFWNEELDKKFIKKFGGKQWVTK